MNTLMLEHSVHYGQNNETPLGFRSGRPFIPSRASPGVTVISHVGVKIPQQNNGVPRRGTMQHSRQGCQEGPVLSTNIGPVDRNNTQRLVPNLKAQRSNPLIHWGKPGDSLWAIPPKMAEREESQRAREARTARTTRTPAFNPHGKCESLALLTCKNSDIHRSAALRFTETWLSENTLDCPHPILGF
ncbi:hypothetical protein GOODEAATRI_021861 [Goodea atripinnis]|uniref:Uncharacterized protein n=1 Tax=Goodea atripinnis TaxID=208336 RepID=A0ABV0N3E6_9TELE